MNFQGVVLAGGGGLSKALLPVENRPLISYVLELMEASNIKDVIVVVAGDEAATQVLENWISNAFDDRLNVEVVSVPEDYETADALRKISHWLITDDFLVVSGDLVSDVPLEAVVAAHRRQDAVVTALLCGRPKLNSSEGSTGSSSKDTTKLPVSDVIGLDSTHQHLLFLASSGQVEKELRMKRSLLRAAGNMEIRTDLVDAHLYAFKRVVVQEILDSRPGIKCIKRDLVPLLIRSQLRLGSSRVTASISEEGSDQPRGGSLENGVDAVSSLTDEVSALLQRVCSNKPSSPWKCCAYVASPAKF
ncbi:translation initiation factor eIF-2B subunit gamma [Marchantia polymorpha subsp. ruderalis]